MEQFPCSFKNYLPPSGSVGELAYVKTGNLLYQWNGTAWVMVGISEETVDAKIAAHIPTRIQSGIEAERPAGVNAGDIYWATNTLKLWAYDGANWQDCKPVYASVYHDNLGTDIYHANDAERVKAHEPYEWLKMKETKILELPESTLKIAFSARSEKAFSSKWKIYRNSVSVGTEHTTNVDYETFTDTIAGWSVGNLIQVYALAPAGENYVRAKNLRILGTITFHPLMFENVGHCQDP
ncbi:unnamed protein product [marine sediment metagenome]|uniref:Uncharacterized protein n=1 Tax=marine sediment metagenome TaxID=412755 RepID=X1RLF8_9ZZZZ